MKVRRLYIPMATRVTVAERQLVERGRWTEQRRAEVQAQKLPAKDRLRIALALLFAGDPYHLDHNPPLAERRWDEATGGYIPPANDPDHLRYLLKYKHKEKTYIRGEHGQYSDIVLIKRQRRRDKAAAGIVKSARKVQFGGKGFTSGPAKLPSRPFPKVHRPMRGRS